MKEFKCPNCKVVGNNNIECVLDGVHHQTVKNIYEDGIVIYNDIESEALVERFQCEKCGYILVIDHEITDDEDLVKWLEKNC